MRVNAVRGCHRWQVAQGRRHRGVFNFVIVGNGLDLGEVGIVPDIGMECGHHYSFGRRGNAAVRKKR